MVRGKVKWFNNAKGFGFLNPNGSTDDVFAHFSQIKMNGYKTLKPGQDIEFDLVEGNKGKQAQNIQLVKE
jgi:CspA family cold shock protein